MDVSWKGDQEHDQHPNPHFGFECEDGTSVVFVVDDDQQTRASVCALVTSMGLASEAFSSAEEFLSSYRGAPGCLVTDVRMLGMSGVELQHKLKEKKISLPVILVSAFARTKLVVEAMQNGAVSFLDKPYCDDELWEAICSALSSDVQERRDVKNRQVIKKRLLALTPKEKMVLGHVVDGKPNKNIATALGVSLRTVENRRREIFTKMQADSVAELVKMVVESEKDS